MAPCRGRRARARLWGGQAGNDAPGRRTPRARAPRGNNDAWRGYGGAVVYTRAAALPPDIVPELRVGSPAREGAKGMG